MRHEESKARRPARVAVALGDHFSKRLREYAAVAGAAGVGLLAAVAPAQAEIIYTPTHITFQTNSSLYLDINNDGTDDFVFYNYADFRLGSTTILFVTGDFQKGNSVRVSALGAAALPRGAEIGPAGKFFYSATMATAIGSTHIGGPWGNVKNRYLGVKFSLNGEEHFGWAEFSVMRGFGIRATLEGYAYETDANRPIRAGQKPEDAEEPDSATPAQTKDGILPAAPAASQPDASGAPDAVKKDGLDSAPGAASLGLLALGSLGLGFWRQKKQESEGNSLL